jgi:hypothetical protein
MESQGASVALPIKRRSFSKLMVGITVIPCWGVIVYALFLAQPGVALAGLGLISLVTSAYMGIGHMDLRAATQAVINAAPSVVPSAPK